MWVVYNKNTGKMLFTFHLKKKAKEFIKSNYWPGADRLSLGLENVNLVKLEEWKCWKILTRRSTNGD